MMTQDDGGNVRRIIDRKNQTKRESSPAGTGLLCETISERNPMVTLGVCSMQDNSCQNRHPMAAVAAHEQAQRRNDSYKTNY